MRLGDFTLRNVEPYSGKYEKWSSNSLIICYGIRKVYVHLKHFLQVLTQVKAYGHSTRKGKTSKLNNIVSCLSATKNHITRNNPYLLYVRLILCVQNIQFLVPSQNQIIQSTHPTNITWRCISILPFMAMCSK